MNAKELIDQINKLIRLVDITRDNVICREEIRFNDQSIKKFVQRFSSSYEVEIKLQESNAYYEVQKKDYIGSLIFVRKIISEESAEIRKDKASVHFSRLIFFILRAGDEIGDDNISIIINRLIQVYVNVNNGIYKKNSKQCREAWRKFSEQRIRQLREDVILFLRYKPDDRRTFNEIYGTHNVYRAYLPTWKYLFIRMISFVMPSYRLSVDKFADLLVAKYGLDLYNYDISVCLKNDLLFHGEDRERFLNCVDEEFADVVRRALGVVYEIRLHRIDSSLLSSLQGTYETYKLSIEKLRSLTSQITLPTDREILKLDEYVFHKSESNDLLNKLCIGEYFQKKIRALTFAEINSDIENSLLNLRKETNSIIEAFFGNFLNRHNRNTSIVVNLKINDFFEMFKSQSANTTDLFSVDTDYLKAYAKKIRMCVPECEEKLRAISEMLISENLGPKDPNKYKFRNKYKKWAATILDRYFKAKDFPSGEILIKRKNYDEELIANLKWDSFTAEFFLNREKCEAICFGPDGDEFFELKEQFFPDRKIPEYISNLIEKTNNKAFGNQVF